MRIVCAGGGTLGSVSPLLAVVEELKKKLTQAVEIKWLGTADGPEKALVEAYKITFQTLSCGKFRRYWSLANIIDVARIFWGFQQALWLFAWWRPDLVLTAGSFVAVPVGWAAWCYGLPVLVHQQDVCPSLTNRLLAPIARLITVVWPETLSHFPRSKAVLTGNPVRSCFLKPPNQPAARAALGLALNKSTVLVMGGGTGASFLNNLIECSLGELLPEVQIIHFTGVGKMGQVKTRPGYIVLPFTTDSLTALAAADVVISRAGMGAITELAALSKASIIVPIPLSHQEDNADYLLQAEAAIVKNQSTLTKGVLVATLRQLLQQPADMVRLGHNLHKLFPSRAAEAVVREIMSILKKK
ncbi:MAG: UDP-N-acetylglucosamine--N-acetylmuramyl-(pentapeptide) pyrophosphoryl-undecaprenol N-acetylglucosamine transferase [Candidatus Kerfeldbacteria bacterium]|nr:UDP-N-acetylglucosamine--N-acetylmuramyl-(pentapeptide) pyrophosphoryl-undecaprenol N-acetylglucosamine transferase [Candidatus Kerfeldbacteria bacterium]